MKANIRLLAVIIFSLGLLAVRAFSESQSTIIADLFVNGTPRGTALFAVDSRGDPLFATGAVRAFLSGVVRDDAMRSALGDSDVVSAIELARAGIHCSFDAASLRLMVDVDPSIMETSDIGFGAKARPRAKDSLSIRPEHFSMITGVALNVNPRYDDDFAGKKASLTADLGLSPSINLFGLVLEGAATITHGGSSLGYELETARAIFDVPSGGLRVTGGWVENRPNSFQGKAKMLGIAVNRESLFPSAVTAGRQDTDNIVLKRMATVTVEVNGTTIRTVRLLPGNYRVADLPLSAGLNDVTILVAEEGSSPRVIKLGIPFDPAILDPGEVYYSSALGVDRSTLSRPFGSAWIGYGLFRALELGVDLQGTQGRYLGGVSALWASPAGYIGLDGSMALAGDSLESVVPSGAARLSWRFSFPANRYAPRLGLAAAYRTAGFLAPSEDGDRHTATARDSWLLSGQVAQLLPFSLGSLGLYADTAIDGSSVSSLSLQAGYFLAFGKSWTISVTGGSDWKSNRAVEPRATVVLAFSPPRFGSIQYRNDITGKSDSLDATVLFGKAGNASIGAHYSNLVWMPGSDTSAGATARVSSGFGELSSSLLYNSWVASGSSSISGNLSASTGIAFGGGAFALGNARDESAVILVPSSSLAGSRVRLRSSDGVEIESRRGESVSLSGLALYLPVAAAVELPASGADKTPAPANVEIIPAYKSVTVIKVRPAISTIVRGKAVDGKGLVAVNESGSVFLSENHAARAAGTFTDEKGIFECYGLNPGDYVIEWSGGKVSRITVPDESQGGLIDLGVVQVALPADGKGGVK